MVVVGGTLISTHRTYEGDTELGTQSLVHSDPALTSTTPEDARSGHPRVGSCRAAPRGRSEGCSGHVSLRAAWPGGMAGLGGVCEGSVGVLPQHLGRWRCSTQKLSFSMSSLWGLTQEPPGHVPGEAT